MKKSIIILGSVLGVGAAAGAGVLIYVLTKPFKADPVTPHINMSIETNLLTTKRTEETITVNDFAPVVTKHKADLEDFAQVVKDNSNNNQKIGVAINYKDAVIYCDVKLKEVGQEGSKKLKVIVNKVYINTYEGNTISDSQIKGTKISAFKEYTRKFIYGLWKLEKDKNADDALTAVKDAIATPTNLDPDKTEF